MSDPSTPRGRRGKPAPEQGAETTNPATEGAGASADSSVALDAGDQVQGNPGQGGADAAPSRGDHATSHAGDAGADAGKSEAEGQAPADQAAVVAATPAQADAGAEDPTGGADQAGAAEGDDVIAHRDLPTLTIRDFARTGDGAIARDSRGRAVVEERPLRREDIIGHREDGDIVHLVLRDGRRIRVSK